MRLVSGLIKNENTILIVQYKKPLEKDYEWFLPFTESKGMDSPKKLVKDYFKDKLNLEVEISGEVLKSSPSHDPDTEILIYPLNIIGGFLKSSDDFKIVKWISPKDVPKYFSARLSYKVSQLLEI